MVYKQDIKINIYSGKVLGRAEQRLIMKKYIFNFFRKLEIYEDLHNSKGYKKDLTIAISKFIDIGDEESAYGVYTAFFKAYWIGVQESDNPFLELTKTIKKYEECAGRLIDNQRDHYIHSVNVFLLGIAIFSANEKYRKYFDDYALDKKIYPDSYNTKNEEFFYRWGLAALFHDIGYPIEITLKQANKYFNFIWCYPKKVKCKKSSFVKIPHFDKFIKLPSLKASMKYRTEFFLKYPRNKIADKNDSVSLLAEYIAPRLGISSGNMKKRMRFFIGKMEKDGFVDHGFYGAVIMARWYYHLLKATKWNPAYFYYPVLDSATAILLHNFYKHVLMKKPFNLRLLRAYQHPIAYLLIICDEIQDWNRKAYGENDNPSIEKDIKLIVNNNGLRLLYKGKRAKNSSVKISKTFVVNECDIFKKGIRIVKGGKHG